VLVSKVERLFLLLDSGITITDLANNCYILFQKVKRAVGNNGFNIEYVCKLEKE
jgi:hypothetical protein